MHPAELLPFVTLALLGSLHCAGMCGGFALAVAAGGGQGRGRFARRQLAHALGKALTYGVLGLALSLGLGGNLVDGPLRAAAAWLAGGTLVLLGLGWLGLVPRWRPRWGPATRLASGFRWLARQAQGLPGGSGAFAAGAVNGLVPCGLSWAALALAATAAPATAFLGPFVFGWTTAPALALVALGPRLTRAAILRRVRPFLPAAIGLALILWGLTTCLRGAPRLHTHGTAAAWGAGSCCETPSHPNPYTEDR